MLGSAAPFQWVVAAINSFVTTVKLILGLPRLTEKAVAKEIQPLPGNAAGNSFANKRRQNCRQQQCLKRHSSGKKRSQDDLLGQTSAESLRSLDFKIGPWSATVADALLQAAAPQQGPEQEESGRQQRLARQAALEELKYADRASDFTFDQEYSNQGSPSKRRKRESFLSDNSAPVGVI
ncbi:hypothetical protein WJX73_009464 [Symbiochloris irregularis]|uniref:Uncharacterized protein n=1 Tax=Symbiochloris irregularis TaxID=706552 RepID=A0AAW1NSH4_9CHLO